jgi:hypothetical protein
LTCQEWLQFWRIAMKLIAQVVRMSGLFPLLGMLLASLSGCATRGIWEGPMLDNFHEPANPSRLGVYEVPEKKDFLIIYDDLGPSQDTVVSRAYFLESNRTLTQRAEKPQFEDPERAKVGVPIPVVDSTNLIDYRLVGSAPYVVRENNQRFSLYREGNTLVGDYDLPTYPTSAGTVKRVLLTPITLTLDATIIGGWLFREFAPALISSARFIR